jgi:hypothetical protein
LPIRSGARRESCDLLKLGVELAQLTVAKYMARRCYPPGQSWKPFLRNHAAAIAAMDLLIVPTIGFRFLYGFVILHYHRRRILSVAVTLIQRPNGLRGRSPKPLPGRRHSDPFSATATALMGMSSGGASQPWVFVIGPSRRCRRGHVKRLIGSIRCECLDDVVVFSEVRLRRILRSYADYHNRVRTLLSLDKGAPFTGPPIVPVVSWRSRRSAASNTNTFRFDFRYAQAI